MLPDAVYYLYQLFCGNRGTDRAAAADVYWDLYAGSGGHHTWNTGIAGVYAGYEPDGGTVCLPADIFGTGRIADFHVSGTASEGDPAGAAGTVAAGPDRLGRMGTFYCRTGQ